MKNLIEKYIFGILATLILVAGLPLVCLGSSNDQNYVMTIEPLIADKHDAYPFHDLSRCKVTYFDGLGRRISTVDMAAATTYDLSDYVIYDGQGRVSREYLPIKTPNAGAEFYNVPGNSEAYYNDAYAYTQTEYDNTPENRVIKLTGPGKEWRQNSTGLSDCFSYTFNSAENAGDDLACVLYEVNSEGKLVNNGYYREATLRVKKSDLPNGYVAMEFTDKSGRKLLYREINGDAQVDTYWVYDDFGRQSFVLSPEGATRLSIRGVCDQSTIDKYCYKYNYDNFGRMISKKLPGIGAVYYVYDKLNQLVLSQNGVQRVNSQWSVTKYDSRNRIAIEGIATLPTATRESLQQEWGEKLMVEQKDVTANYESDLFYTNTCGISNFTALKAYYYDDNSHWDALLPINHPAGFYNHTYADSKSVNGMLTGMGIGVQDGTGEFIVTLIKYDAEGNKVMECERDYFGQNYETVTTMQYNFRNKMTQKRVQTFFVSEQYIMSSYKQSWSYSYDYWDNLTDISYQFGDKPWILLADYQYDDMNRVKTLRYGGKHYIHYNYNMRGWLTSQSGSKFIQNLYYHNGDRPLLARYDGNVSQITETRWRENAGTEKNIYTASRYISYDPLRRITGIVDSEDFLMSESFDYDLNGNPTAIVRGGNGNDTMDNITLEYDGNQIVSVSDNPTFDFELGKIPQLVGGNYPNAMAYDENGRPKYDRSRNVEQIQYNHLDLPTYVRFGKNADNLNDGVYYTYRADGVKMSEISSQRYIKMITTIDKNGNSVTKPRVESNDISRTYYGNVVKTNGSLRFYNEMGYVDYDAQVDSAIYYYYERDYLGSVRAIVDKNGAMMQAMDYYSTGIPHSKLLAQPVDNRMHTGKEFQNLNGLGWYDNSARQMDAILGRFTTLDPLAEKYYNISPYAHCANNPIKYIDPDGRKLEFAKGTSDAFKQTFSQTVQYMNEKGTSGNLAKLQKSSEIFYIMDNSDASFEDRGSLYSPETKTIYWDSTLGIETTDGGYLSPTTILDHEGAHAVNQMTDSNSYNERRVTKDDNYGNEEEKNVIMTRETEIAIIHGETPRTNHSGHYIKTSNPTKNTHPNELEIIKTKTTDEK